MERTKSELSDMNDQNKRESDHEDDKREYKKFLDGEISGFETLVLRHKDGLIYYLYHIVKDFLLAEDFAQDAFVEVYVHKERYHFKTSFKTYLYTIGRNKAVDYIRKNSRMLFVDEYPEQVDLEELENKIIKEEEKRELYKAIKELKKEYKEAITLIDFEGMSYEEAAVILGKSIPQMKVLIHRARKGLAAKMKKGCNGS